MKAPKDGSGDYVMALVFVFLGLAAFLVAIIGVYFGGVGLYFGQGIVETDVFEDKYKYTCITEVDNVCTVFNTSDELDSWSDYQTFRSDINATIPLFITATTVLFSLLGLVFLFLALRTSGLWKKKKETKSDEY